jgi:uncharacterized protein (TIGR00251 family)
MRPLRVGKAGARGGGCAIGIRLKPGSSREKIVSIDGNEISMAVTAAPVDGKANDAMIRLLAKTLDIPKSSITLRRGAASRNKLVEIGAMTSEEVLKKLNEAR